ncbi:sensory box histidine kinase/response regulator [Legionella adelaidensis]|uniref:histidine kinase n=1 Tax=Legionella adelaidensis TaxID=45056 RepID=A0A0W0R6D5_9GAMM|nr:PAS domain-containing sensor histidine kinase [Legionella adelaidensis]KTC66625.1 sensory box histidine kinase/response regulator [Legionella adelaidensis]VEH81048.1 sensory box histidine kinase/response regulator [Legionella adelaidensis]
MKSEIKGNKPQSLFDLAFPAVLLDKKATIIDCNECFLKLVAFPKNKIIASNLRDVFQHKNIAFPLTNLTDAAEFETTIPLGQDKLQANYKWTLTKVKNSKEEMFTLLGVNSEMVSSLENKDTITQSIIDQLPHHYIFWKDKNSVYLGCNHNLATAIGLQSSDEIVGKTDYDLPTTKEQSDTYREDDRWVIETGNPKLNIEETQTLSDGQTRILSTNKTPLRNKAGEIYGVLAIYSDITRQKELEQSLEEAKNKAEAASLAKTEFIANMSHDIRTPLSGVVGMSELLEEIAINEQQKEYAQSINQCAEQLLSLLNGILDVVSADNVNENDIHIENFELKNCLQSLIDLERPSTSLKGLFLNLDIDKRTPVFLFSDRTKIHRILLNLLGNAIKFTKEGGVTIQVDCMKKEKEFTTLRFSVKDTGIGIAQDKLKKVFQRFYRVEASYKGVYTGHGLGLHIAQVYAKLLGSKINVESEEGKGTTFYFDLKCKIGGNPNRDRKEAENLDVKVQNKKTKITNETTSTNAPTILLVEDNAIALKMAEIFALRAGFQLSTAIDGTTALTLVKKNNFSLIVTDIGLPDISGLQLTQLIREWEMQENKKSIPIIGLTAHVGDEAKEECIQAGMNDVFSKPVNLEMMQTIKQYLHPEESSDKNSSDVPLLGADLPNTEKELFAIEQYPLIDMKSGIQNSGNEELLKQMLLLMGNQELPKDVEALKNSYKTKDWNAVEKIAHKMKGGAIYIGTIRMKFACQFLERYIKAGNVTLREPLYEQLLKVVEETVAAINATASPIIS